jgi:hypothetical protein
MSPQWQDVHAKSIGHHDADAHTYQVRSSTAVHRLLYAAPALLDLLEVVPNVAAERMLGKVGL